MEKAYQKSVEQIARELDTDLKNGLSSSGAQNKLQKSGPNVLKESKGKNPFFILLSQFKSFLVLILLAASLAAYFLGETIDAVMIIAIVLLNTSIGFIQEYRVEKAIQHLKKLVTLKIKVIRDGELLEIPSSQLVAGDLVKIEEGQKVPADIRISQSFNLHTIEASLTGESTPIAKDGNPLSEELAIADRKNMLFSGTFISSGEGMGIVVTTGMETEIGNIAKLVTTQKDTSTPMQKKLNNLGKLIGRIVLIVAVIVILEEILYGRQYLQAIMSAIALVVAAIPEGLPAVITISLALGARRLLKQNALIRNLSAAETLGSTDVICTDKTGTLTEGIMAVRKINGEEQKVLKAAVLASNARVSGEKIIGDPTEAALIASALEKGINQHELIKEYTRVHQIPFSSDRKIMTTVNQNNKGYYVAVKGATEMILSKCSNLDENQKKEILKINDQMAKSALRVLAFADKQLKQKKPVEPSGWNDQELESNLNFLGLVGMIDPPRKEVKESIKLCHQAGIKVIMITGDHLLTAQAIAKEIGIVGRAISGVELDKLSSSDFNTQVEEISIYARVSPEHKIRIIKALKNHGHQVAMTGDGVNDAPALKVADIGVAMGISGTDVAKDQSDMILLDDHFKTIVEAVKEGRGIYENIRKFVNYLLSSNMMEVAIILIAVILGWPLPLLPIHLLWINLITDGLPAVALGVDPSRPDIMKSPPASFREEIINAKFFRTLIIVSSILTVAVLGIFGFTKNDLVHAQTMTFTAIVLYELIRITVIRSEYKLPFFSNPFLVLAIVISLGLQLLVLYLPITLSGNSLQTLFRVEALSIMDWLVLFLVGAVLFLVIIKQGVKSLR